MVVNEMAGAETAQPTYTVGINHLLRYVQHNLGLPFVLHPETEDEVRPIAVNAADFAEKPLVRNKSYFEQLAAVTDCEHQHMDNVEDFSATAESAAEIQRPRSIFQLVQNLLSGSSNHEMMSVAAGSIEVAKGTIKLNAPLELNGQVYVTQKAKTLVAEAAPCQQGAMFTSVKGIKEKTAAEMRLAQGHKRSLSL